MCDEVGRGGARWGKVGHGWARWDEVGRGGIRWGEAGRGGAMCEEVGRRGATLGDVGEAGQCKAGEGKARWRRVLGSPTSQYHAQSTHVARGTHQIKAIPQTMPFTPMCGIRSASGRGMQNPQHLMNIMCGLLGRQRLCTKPTQSLEVVLHMSRLSPAPSRMPLVASCFRVPRCVRSLTFSPQRLPTAV